MAKEYIIGIDLGTTNSCTSVMKDGKPEILINQSGGRTTPSIVSYKGDNTTIGDEAKNQLITNPKNTIYACKRLIGKKFKDPEIAEFGKQLSYQLIEADNGDVWIQVGDKKLAPQQIAAEILGAQKKLAEDALGTTIKKAVITVPAYFNDSQRQATKDAGIIAGLDVLRIINEPTAAALSYGFNTTQQDQKIVVYDLGGGTFDVSVIDIHHVDGENQIEVIATNGDTSLGGEDFDNALSKHIIAEFNAQYPEVDLYATENALALQRIKSASEEAKKALSNSLQTKVLLSYLVNDASGPKHLDLNITRSKFESLVEHLVQRTLEPCRKALEDGKLQPKDIGQVIFVGGQTRMPLVTTTIEQFFNTKVIKSTVNPDEAVALGAAIQGGVLAGDVSDVLLLDVTPLTLGIETLGGVMTKIIERNTTLPCKRSQVFSTAENNQTQVVIHVLQGERPLASHNHSLAQFELRDIPPARKGEPQIEVSFDLDASGMLNVSAVHKQTGKSQNISVQPSGGLEEKQIEQMIKDADINREKDNQHAELINTANKADQTISVCEKFLEDQKDLPSEDVKKLQDLIQQTKEAVKSTERTQTSIENAIKALEIGFGEVSKKAQEKRVNSDNTGTTTSGQEESKQPVEEDHQEVEI